MQVAIRNNGYDELGSKLRVFDRANDSVADIKLKPKTSFEYARINQHFGL